MTPALFFLLIVLVLKGLVIFVPSLESVGVVVGWVLAIFIGATLLYDFFRNIPGFLLNEKIGSLSRKQTQAWQLRYIFFMGFSAFIRIITVLLLIQWFLFPSVQVF